MGLDAKMSNTVLTDTVSADMADWRLMNFMRKYPFLLFWLFYFSAWFGMRFLSHVFGHDHVTCLVNSVWIQSRALRRYLRRLHREICFRQFLTKSCRQLSRSAHFRSWREARFPPFLPPLPFLIRWTRLIGSPVLCGMGGLRPPTFSCT